MIFNVKPRKVSYKDFSAHKTHNLGASIFLDELLFLTPILDQNPLAECTAYASVATRDSEVLNAVFDPAEFWNDELALHGVTSAPDGFDLKTPAAVGVKTGFVLTGNQVRQNQGSAYFWITAGNGQDLFDNIRSTIQNFQRPVMAGLRWYDEYMTPDGVMTDNGKTLNGGHCVKIAGWTTKNGIPYLVLQNSWGTGYGDQGKFYMPRAMVNKLIAPFGCFYWSDDQTLVVKKMGLLQALLQNLINLYQTLFAQKDGYPPPPVVIPHVSRIEDWAHAIQVAEGWKGDSVSFINNNPGNLKYSSLTASWGGVLANAATDGGRFCKFPDYATGFKALCNFLTLGADNQLLAFHKARTLQQFTVVFAGNPPQGYITTICTQLKVAPNINISSLL